MNSKQSATNKKQLENATKHRTERESKPEEKRENCELEAREFQMNQKMDNCSTNCLGTVYIALKE